MKTTLDLPDHLVRAIKIRAVNEDKTMKELVTELLERGLESPQKREPRRVKLPLFDPGPRIPGVRDLTDDEIKELMLDQEVEWAMGR